jgi:vitamin B12 transporter
LLAAALLSCAKAAQAADQRRCQHAESGGRHRHAHCITADEVLSSVTVITHADIERLQPPSVQDLLACLPGVSFANSGGIGQQTSLFMRGTNSSHTLVLIDSVRIGSVGNGLPAFEQLPVEQIDRIEIVRGPRSSLYGVDVIGGVIQSSPARLTRWRSAAFVQRDHRQRSHLVQPQRGRAAHSRHQCLPHRRLRSIRRLLCR